MYRLSVAGYLPLMVVLRFSFAVPSHMTVYRYNGTDITINGSVSVSVKSEGQFNALLLLLYPVGQEVKVNGNCQLTNVQNAATGLRDNTTTPNIRKTITMKDSHLPMGVGASPLRSRASAKVTLQDIVAARVSGESNSLLSPQTTLNPSISQFPKLRNCLEVQDGGKEESGLYDIHPFDCCHDRSVEVFCDMVTDGGGWTVVQRRTLSPTQENFFRDWQSYTNGFGNLTQEFWLGLDVIHALTNQSAYEIRFDLGDFEGVSRWAKYSSFHVGSGSENYKMEVGGYSGDAGDSFTRHNGMPFETMDRQSSDECASAYKGAWWYSICHDSNLNGQYLHGEQESYADGVNWRSWKGYYYSLKFTEMKIRPKSV